MKEDFVLKDTDQHVQPERLEDLQFLVLIDPAFHLACVPHTGRGDYRSIMRSTGTAYFSWAAGDLDLSPNRADQLFRPRVLADPCNPTTWRSRSETGRMSCLVRRLVSKSCLIITHPAALPPKYCVGSVGRIASGKVVVIRQLQPSGIL